jgi:sporulation protein YqfC
VVRLRKQGAALEIAERFDLPPEVLPGVPRLTLTGTRRALVENHRGLLEYGRERVEINGGRVRLRLNGEDLELRAMDTGSILITGEIFSVEFL